VQLSFEKFIFMKTTRNLLVKCSHYYPFLGVTGQNGIGQNGTDKMVAISIDSNSTELNFYSVITSHK